MCDCERPEVFEQKIVTLRKERKCSECGILLPKGVKAVRTDGLWDGSWTHYYQCEDCDKIFSYALRAVDECLLFTQLYSGLSDADVLGPWKRKAGEWLEIEILVPWLKLENGKLKLAAD